MESEIIMTQTSQAETSLLQIGVCDVCDALFLMSGRRQTSPCHGADPLAVLATLMIGENGRIHGYWGIPAPGDSLLPEFSPGQDPAAVAAQGESSPKDAEIPAEGVDEPLD